MALHCALEGRKPRRQWKENVETCKGIKLPKPLRQAEGERRILLRPSAQSCSQRVGTSQFVSRHTWLKKDSIICIRDLTKGRQRSI